MHGPTLAVFAFLTDAACIAATHSWPVDVPSGAVYLLLALGWCLSVAAYLALRSHGGSDGGTGPPDPDPEPPWWPEFERQFRDHTRGRSGPREPASTSSR